jgi:hypothetical protein
METETALSENVKNNEPTPWSTVLKNPTGPLAGQEISRML